MLGLLGGQQQGPILPDKRVCNVHDPVGDVREICPWVKELSKQP